MKKIIISIVFLFAFSAGAKEMRCGWIHSPSPSNIWLIDADASWTISLQGMVSELIEESYDLLEKTSADSTNYVNTKGDYGFSCTCLTVTTDKATQTIKLIHTAKQLPLKTCLEDKAINKKIPL